MAHSGRSARQFPTIGGRGLYRGGGLGIAGGLASGGGIYVKSGSLTLTSSNVTNNQATGGNGGGGGAMTGTYPFADRPNGGPGGAGGNAAGGGIYMAAGSLIIVSGKISNNQLQGGAGGNGGNATAVTVQHGFSEPAAADLEALLKAAVYFLPKSTLPTCSQLKSLRTRHRRG